MSTAEGFREGKAELEGNFDAGMFRHKDMRVRFGGAEVMESLYRWKDYRTKDVLQE
jgi:hypothetical protein